MTEMFGGWLARERTKMEEKNLFAPGDVVRHAKGNEYKIVGRCVFEPMMVSCYLYRGENGCTWARPVAQMEDGRFSLVATSNSGNERTPLAGGPLD